jgi:NAD(P)H-flavin reductase
MVSTTLVRHASVGDTLLLGPARGGMSVPGGDRDLLCVAGGTGLAPIKAIIEAAAGRRGGVARRITLFAGARRQRDLYDLPDLLRLQAACPALRVIPVLSDEYEPPAAAHSAGWISGALPDVVRAHGLFEHSEAFICGPEPMVRQTALLLSAHVPAEQIHHDPIPDDHGLPAVPAGAAGAGPDAAVAMALSAKFARPGLPPGPMGPIAPIG